MADKLFRPSSSIEIPRYYMGISRLAVDTEASIAVGGSDPEPTVIFRVYVFRVSVNPVLLLEAPSDLTC